MKIKAFLFIFVLFVAMPILAQSDNPTTYTFEDTGTTIDYPSDWEGELTDGIYVIQNTQQSQVLVIDYPAIATVAGGQDISPVIAVQELVNLLIESEIEADEVYEFSVGDRAVYAYDIALSVTGSVYVIEFTNGTLGAIITIEVDQLLETDFLLSFDNADAPVADVSVPSGNGGSPRSQPSVFLFDTNQRFFVPAGWTLDLRERNGAEYAILFAPEADAVVRLIDVSTEITKGAVLEEVIDSVSFDWETDFGITIEDAISDYALGDREAISYPVTVDNNDGYLIVLRYSNDDIGVVIVSGDDTASFELQITQLIGSFNYLGAVLDYMR